VAALVKKETAGRDLRFIGWPRVNVLQLDFALDGHYPVT
jgi:K+-transporting ATPase c subunit